MKSAFQAGEITADGGSNEPGGQTPAEFESPVGTPDSSPVVKAQRAVTPGKHRKIIRARAASRMRCRGGRQITAPVVSPEPSAGTDVKC